MEMDIYGYRVEMVSESKYQIVKQKTKKTPQNPKTTKNIFLLDLNMNRKGSADYCLIQYKNTSIIQN